MQQLQWPLTNLNELLGLFINFFPEILFPIIILMDLWTPNISGEVRSPSDKFPLATGPGEVQTLISRVNVWCFVSSTVQPNLLSETFSHYYIIMSLFAQPQEEACPENLNMGHLRHPNKWLMLLFWWGQSLLDMSVGQREDGGQETDFLHPHFVPSRSNISKQSFFSRQPSSLVFLTSSVMIKL